MRSTLTTLLLIVLASNAPAQADLQRASRLMGATVVTQDGRELGKVRDIAFDERTAEIRYVVVSVGSFLIESSLIAVEPDALVPVGDGAWTLLAEETALRAAERFADDQWPATASIRRNESAPPPVEPTVAVDASSAAQKDARGTATIADARKIAYLTGTERTIRETSPPPTPSEAPKPPAEKTAAGDVVPGSRFDKLDRNHDGVLDRAEIAHEITYKDSYAELDADGDDAINRAEFEVLQRKRQ